MYDSRRSCFHPPAPLQRSLLSLAIGLLAAQSAGAHLLISNTVANESFYNYNTAQGAVAAGGTSGGSTGTGGGNAVSFSSYAGGSGNFAASSNASAQANLSTASLHATAITDGFYGDARGYAELNDTVTFHIAGAAASTITNVVIDLMLTGSISQFQHASYLYNFTMFSSGSGVGVGWETVLYDSPSDARNYVGWAVSGGLGFPNGFESWQTLVDNATEKHFRGVLAVPGADKEYGLRTAFNLRCSNGTDCDFGNSAHLNFELPAGVTFTSGSGLLLTAAGVVPEPQTYGLVLGGLALLGWVGRRRGA